MSFRVGSAGIIVEDTFCGPLSELPPEGLLVAVESMPTRAGGCAANVAIDLAKQGITVDIIGCIGRDAAGAGLRECFRAHGIGCEHLVTSSDLPTSRTVILLVAGEDRRYLHSFGANAAFAASAIPEDWLRTLHVFYLGGLFAMPSLPCRRVAEVFRLCRKHGVKTVLDVVVPHGRSAADLRDYETVLAVTDYFLPNDDEAAVLTGCRDTDEQLARFLGLGVGTAIITRGENGVVAARGDDCWECDSHTLAVVDPSGAGDAFASGVIASLETVGDDMPAMLRYASAVGALATRAIGTTDGVMSRAETRAFTAAHPLSVRHRRLGTPAPRGRRRNSPTCSTN